MAEKFKIGVLEEMDDVSLCSGIEVIDAEDIVALVQKALTEMGTEETGAPCHQNTDPILIFHPEPR
jgi:hypothetical protein